MRRNSRGQDENAIDMTPMLDVVFILLIFFIVTSSLDQSQQLEVTLPSASESTAPKNKNFEIQIDKNEEIIFDGERYSFAEALTLLLEKSSEFEDLIVYADKDLRTGVFVRLADYAKASGYSSVAIATKEAY